MKEVSRKNFEVGRCLSKTLTIITDSFANNYNTCLLRKKKADVFVNISFNWFIHQKNNNNNRENRRDKVKIFNKSDNWVDEIFCEIKIIINDLRKINSINVAENLIDDINDFDLKTTAKNFRWNKIMMKNFKIAVKDSRRSKRYVMFLIKFLYFLIKCIAFFISSKFRHTFFLKSYSFHLIRYFEPRRTMNRLFIIFFNVYNLTWLISSSINTEERWLNLNQSKKSIFVKINFSWTTKNIE